MKMTPLENSIQFKRAGTSDLPAILSLMPLYYEADHLVFEKKKAEKALGHFISNASLGQLWLVQDVYLDRTIGYAAVAFGYSLEFGGRDAIVDELFVLPEFQGQGIGTLTLQHLLTECKAAEIKALRLEVTPTNPRALKLYKKIGFKDLGRSLLAYEI